jgi:hypothetical protein
MSKRQDSITTKTNKAKLSKAKEMHKKFINLRVSFRAHWSIYGRMAVEFEREELFKLMGHRSMKGYLKSLPGVCYSTIAEAMAVQKAFPKMSVEQLAQFPKENLKIIAKLPESKRERPEILDAAKKLMAKDLRARLNKKHDVHLEAKVRLLFDVEESAVQIIEGAVALEQKTVEDEDDEQIGRGEALERICTARLQSK